MQKTKRIPRKSFNCRPTIMLTSDIQQAFKNKQNLIVVFFDLEKAYDRTSAIIGKNRNMFS